MSKINFLIMRNTVPYFVLLALAIVIVPHMSFAQTMNNSEISGEDLATAKKVALADEKVQSYLSGKNYTLMSYGLSTDDKTKPDIQLITLVYGIDNKDQLAVSVDVQDKVVTTVQYLPGFMPKFQPAVEKQESTFSTVITTISPLLMIFAIGGVVAITIILLKKRIKRSSAMTHN